MKKTHRIRQLIRITLTSAFLLSVLCSSGLPLEAQAPVGAEDQVDQLYLPLISNSASVDTLIVEDIVEDTDENQPNQHQLDDAVEHSMEPLTTNPDPSIGLISAEVQAAAVSGPPNEIGQWSEIISTPLIPIFASLLPNGNVLMWDTDDNYANGQNNQTRVVVWNPNTNSFTRADVEGHNIFCSGFTHLSDGRVFVAGGNIRENEGIPQTHIFDSANNSWTQGPNMSQERWYPSVAALPNEELFIMGGLTGSDLHEVYQTDNRLRNLTSARLDHDRNYPFIQAAPDGRVLYAGPDTDMRMIDTSGGGTWQSYGTRENTDRDYGSYAMYDIGKVIVAGGATPATQSARLIDAADGSPSASSTSNMNFARRQHNLTILPTGSVLATGGLDGDAALVDLDRGVYAAEVWNPETERWTELASMQVTRQYHSTALLLPDGRVMTGGGGYCGDCNAVGYNRFDMEIFSPPYLFDASGNLAARPTLSSVASEISFASSFTINSPDAPSINKVAMIRLGAPTHSQNMGQRYIALNFSRSGSTLTATAPANANIAPPGYYMLFLIDNMGVPSVAKFVNINQADDPRPDGSTIQIRAKGQEGAERMELRIDNAVVQSWTVSTSFANYNYTHSSSVEADQISVHFTNDQYDAATRYDHNLTVDKMILDGTPYESEAATVEAKGVSTPNGCKITGFFQKELLYCNGYFKYNAEDDGGNESTVQVFAKGDEGEEKMDLRIDGQTVRSWTVSNSAGSYEYTHGASINANQISVHFTNDGRDTSIGYDLNLTVDKIVLNGTTYQTEAATVQGQGPWNGSTCSSVAFHRTEKLHCNGYFRY